MTSSAITNKSRSPITHEKTETRFKKVLRRSFRNFLNHCLELYLDTRGFFQRIRSTTQLGDREVYPQQGLFVQQYFSTIRLVLARPRISFRLTETSVHNNMRFCFGPPKDFLWPSRVILAQWLLLYERKYMIALSLPLGQPRLVLARPRNSSPHVKDLVINPLGPTVIFSQVNMCILMVCPRIWLKLPARFISPSSTSSHLHILPVQLHLLVPN
jgi:hypothetical protein